MLQQKDIPKHWDAYYEPGRDFRTEPSQTISKFLGYASAAAPKTALDIGCGTGHLSRELYHCGYKTVGVDISEVAVAAARPLTIVARDQLDYMRFDIEHDDLASLPLQPYGLITCRLVYAFMRNKRKFLDNVA